MNSVIILEGPDGAGKTTLAERLKKEYGYKVLHEGPPPRDVNVLEYYAVKVMRAVRQRKRIVFDRLHLGEHVYGAVARSNDRLTYMGVRLMRRLCWAQCARVVICLPSLLTCEDNWGNKYNVKRDVVHDRERFTDVYHRFEGLTAYYERFDYVLDSFEQMFDQNVRVRPPLPAGVIGHPFADILVVGERPKTSLDLPFFGCVNSSRFINDALADAGYSDAALALVNAVDARGRNRNLEQVLVALQNFKVAIALGRIAEGACLRAGLQHIFVPHPQNWKRFHAKEYQHYVRQLQEAREYV